jgi:phosphoserine phosphatase
LELKLIAFDMDGTLVKEPSSWTRIHRHFGVEGSARYNMPLYETGKIDYDEFMRRDIALWPRKLHVKDIDLAFSDYSLHPDARNVTARMRQLGYDIAIVSAGLDLLANKIAKALGLTSVIANGLQTDDRGYLTGRGVFRVDPLHKDIALETLLKGKGITLNECMSVGDSKYDLTFLQRAAIGVAVGNDPVLARVATRVIDDLSELIPFVESLGSKLMSSS